MSQIKDAIPLAKKILKEYDLCDNCLGRIFSKTLRHTSNKIAGRKLRQLSSSKSKSCYVCKNIFDSLESYVTKMINDTKNHEFSTFLVGAILKPSIVDRDDQLRSNLKLRGTDSIKSDITKEIGKHFSKKTGKRILQLNPDLTFTIDFKKESCQFHTKTISFQGYYTKNKRGIPQKQRSCSNCLGKGCKTCNLHGISEFDSIEGQITKLILDKFGGTTCKFTWVGGEDKDSLVFGKGRPFFVKLHCPVARTKKFPKSIILNSITVLNLKRIPDTPKHAIMFDSTILINIHCTDVLPALQPLKILTKKPIIVYEQSGKRSEKRIHKINFKKLDQNNFSLTIKADGGLPVKRLVEGNDINPSISDILGHKCKCKEFDFQHIEMK